MDTLIIGLVLFVILLRILLRTWLKGFGQAPLRQQVGSLRPAQVEKMFPIFFYQGMRIGLAGTFAAYIHILWSVRSLESYFESSVYAALQNKDEVLATMTFSVGIWTMSALSISQWLFPSPPFATFGAARVPGGLAQLRWLYAGYVYAAVGLLLLRFGYSTNEPLWYAHVAVGGFLSSEYFRLFLRNTRVLKELTAR